MAELFLAQEPPKPGLVVIKRILPYLNEEPEFVRMFLDEARIAAQLHHPNIVQVHELGMLDERIFIAMEYVEGVDLRRLMAEEAKHGSPVPYAVAARICAHVAAGLDHAHNSKGVDGRPLELIHRDVSPQNVMIAYDGRVKLVDFGIAKAGAFVERSKPGIIKGKFLYLAPEQVSQDKLDHRADIFALGSMLYEVTTGRAPFHRSSMEAILYAIRFEEPSPPHLLRSDYPLELSRIVTRCMAKDRTQRYQHASEVREELEALLRSGALKQESDVASYIAHLLGSEEERTQLHRPAAGAKPARGPAPTVPAMKPARRAEPRLSTPSQRGELLLPQELLPPPPLDMEDGEQTMEEPSARFAHAARRDPPPEPRNRRSGSVPPVNTARRPLPPEEPSLPSLSRRETLAEESLELPPPPPDDEPSGPTLSRRATVTEQPANEGTLLELPASPPRSDSTTDRLSPLLRQAEASITANDSDGDHTQPLLSGSAASRGMDEESTVDYQRPLPVPPPRPRPVHAPSAFPEQTLALTPPHVRRQRLRRLLVALAVLAALGLGVWLALRSRAEPVPPAPPALGELAPAQEPAPTAAPQPAEPAPPTPAPGQTATAAAVPSGSEQPLPAPAALPEPAPSQPPPSPSPEPPPAQPLATVRFEAPKGTVISLSTGDSKVTLTAEARGSKAFLSGEVSVPVGKLSIRFRCPARRFKEYTYTVKPSPEVVVLPVPCQGK